MTEPSNEIVIDYYSDVLCVWAWIAQPRLEELHRQWGQQIRIRHRYVDIFGDTANKIPRQWGESDGYSQFHAHVVKSALPFEQVSIHENCWTRTRPRTSMNAHLLLKATGLVAGDEALENMARTLRQQFFAEGRDIGHMGELMDIARELALDIPDLEQALSDGSAMAALSNDLRTASDMGIKGSPTWALNQGRQLLYGNVGYRILNANIEELVNNPADEASWC
ncbi:MAG: DsbA family protein [Halioglobus sp.]